MKLSEMFNMELEELDVFLAKEIKAYFGVDAHDNTLLTGDGSENKPRWAENPGEQKETK